MAKSKPTPKTIVTFLLDRSGSMSAIKSQTIEGFNSYITGLQSDKKAKILFTFLQFDSESLDKVHVAVPIQDVPLLTDKTFSPRGGTPLIDAAYKTILAVEDACKREDIAPKVVICIQTDGEENASSQYNWDQLSSVVKAKQEMGWQFNFMGAGIDAYKQAARMGVSVANTMSYNNMAATTDMAFAASAANTMSYARGMAESTGYTAAQKTAAGDEYDPALKRGAR